MPAEDWVERELANSKTVGDFLTIYREELPEDASDIKVLIGGRVRGVKTKFDANATSLITVTYSKPGGDEGSWKVFVNTVPAPSKPLRRTREARGIMD